MPRHPALSREGRSTVSMREREGLIARVRQLRRVAAARDTASAPAGGADPDAAEPAAPPAGRADPDPAELEALQRRLNDLEQLVQGLQDSVHRETLRLSKRVAELDARTQPAALGEALSRDARERGL
jgi:hypothetical protein